MVEPKAGISTGRRDTLSGPSDSRISAVMGAAARSGFTSTKDGRIGGRVSRKLIAAAKARTGIAGDSDLLEYALVNLALEDNFAEDFRASHGTIDPGLDLTF